MGSYISYFTTIVNDRFGIMADNKDAQYKGAKTSADNDIENHETRNDSTGIFMLKG